MKKALITFATGAEHLRYLEVSQPLFQAYADRHGYDFCIVDPITDGRPASWGKVLPIKEMLLNGYDRVLWLDCDVVIVDGTADIDKMDHVGRDQLLVKHHTNCGEVPNCGVWCVRHTDLIIQTLDDIWIKFPDLIDHGWWEQAAMMSLLGYNLQMPCQLVKPTPLYDFTGWLGTEWNSHRQDRSPTPRFEHVTPGHHSTRLAVMQYLASQVTWHKEAICGSK